VGDPVGDDPRLAAPRPREDEEGPVSGEDGVALRRVQVVEEMLQGCRHRRIVPYPVGPVASGARHSGPHRAMASRLPGSFREKRLESRRSGGGTSLAVSVRMRATKRILIVDDNPVVQEVLKQFLMRGYQVEVATNASQALAAVVQKSPDAILLDVRMPGVDGLGLLKSLRGMGVETPIFVMTGYDSTQVALEALETGATGYLPKPFDLLHLDKLIAHALGSQPAYA
jgi:CheY-like chemotaxis protein